MTVESVRTGRFQLGAVKGNRLGLILAGLVVVSIVWLTSSEGFRRAGLFGQARLVADQVVEVGLGLVAFVLFVLLIRRRRVTVQFGLLLALLGWLYLRGIVDGDHTPLLFAGLSTIIIIFYVVDRYGVTLSRPLILYPFALLLLGVVYAYFFPQQAFLEGGYSDYFGDLPLGNFSGNAGHHNRFGPIMAFGLIVVMAQQRAGWVLAVVGLLLFGGLVASGSDGALVAVVAAVAAMFLARDFFDRSFKKFPWRTTLVGAVLAFLVARTILLISMYGISQFTTGRDSIYSSFVEPAFGAGVFGLGRFPDFIARNPELFDDIATRFTNPHNSWLATQIISGYLGTTLFAAFWIAVVIGIWRSTDNQKRVMAIGLSIFLFAHGMVETHFLPGWRFAYPMYGLLAAMFTRPVEPAEMVGGPPSGSRSLWARRKAGAGPDPV